MAYLVQELNKIGVKNYLAIRKGSELENFCKLNGFQYFYATYSNSFDILSALKVKEICNSMGIDIIHMHTSNAHGIGVLSVLFGNKTRMILSRRVDFRLKSNLLSQWKYNHIAIKRILCVSTKIKEIMQQEVVNKDKCITVYSGIDVSKFTPSVAGENQLRTEFKISSEYVLIGNTSALVNHKDYFTFIDTISHLINSKTKVHAFIIGEGSLKVELQDYIKEKGLDKDITFAGFRNDIKNILPCLDIFLMTSKEEGLGTSILDAFCAKVPVVATKAGGIPEMVVHQQTGMLAHIGDSKTLAQYVTTLINNPELKAKIIFNALETVQKFSKEATAAKTFEIYKQVLREN